MSISAAEFLKWCAVFNVQGGGGSPINLPLAMSAGGTEAALVPTENALFYSTDTTGALLPSVASRVFMTDGAGGLLWGATLPAGIMSAAPSGSSDVANKAYVDSVAAGLNPAQSVYAASTANLAGYVYDNGVAGVGATLTAGSNGVFTADGLSVPQDEPFLYKNDTDGSGAYNGVYIVTDAGSVGTPAILTRASYYNSPANINDTGLIPVVNGTVNQSTGWLLVSDVVTVGTSPLTYIQFGQQAGVVPIANGGTGASDASTARTNLGLGTLSTLNSVAVSNLSNGTAGALITYDAAGVPTIISPGAAGTVLTANGAGNPSTYQSVAGAGDMLLAGVQTVTGAKTYNDGTLILAGLTSGTSVLKASAIAGTTTLTLPSITDTLVGRNSNDTLTNKSVNATNNTIINLTWSMFATGTPGQIPTWDGSNNPALVATGTAGQFLGSNGAGLPPTMQQLRGGLLTNVHFYTTSTTWTKPASFNSSSFIIVKLVGGGGGSGGVPATAASDTGGSGGGGSGAYAVTRIFSGLLSSTETVTVGARGTAGTAGATTGGTGGTSSFGGFLTCTGGAGGAAGFASSAATQSLGGTGGIANGGDLNFAGSRGFRALSLPVAGVTYNISQGAGAASPVSAMTNTIYPSAAILGVDYGAGAAGGSSVGGQVAIAGAQGGAGFVMVEEYV